MAEYIKLYNEIPLFDENEGHEPYITPYLVGGKNNACVVVCPGGAYEWLAPHEGEPVARWLNSIGVSAIVLTYRVNPYAYPVQLLDVQRAIKLVKYKADEFGIDPEKVLTIGFSAGGHLAGMGGIFVDNGHEGDEVDALSSSVAGMILCYPVISFTQHQHVGSAVNLCGDNPELMEKLSLEKAADKNLPPLFLWHTFTDETVDVRNSLMLAMRYKELSLNCEAHIFPHGTHGMSLAKDDECVGKWTEMCRIWLKNKGFINN